ncbi:MAG: CehA/McbA family metallohydrolase, partial [Sandaracinaceae bacterium]|nr:CehA/McbA family metallohydrolase [Sandaracinaceae bacterium]
MQVRHRLGTLVLLGLGSMGCPGPEEPMPDAAPSLDAPEGMDAPPVTCEGPATLETGGEGAASPLPVPSGAARAGRIAAADLPTSSSGLAVWEANDFVLANEHVGLVIEDVDRSDLYDPWGGRPVGIARVEDGRLVDAADYGEMFVLVGRHTVLTESVSVMNDGADGEAAVVRAVGWLRPLPFFENITGGLLRADLSGVRAAIDYVLEPGSHHVDVFVEYASGPGRPISTTATLHGFLYAERTPAFVPGAGFALPSGDIDRITWVDDRGVSWTYEVPGNTLGGGISESGFVGRIGSGFTVRPCSSERRLHARLTIGDAPGLDAALAVRAAENGESLRTIEGFVYEADGSPAVGARVHALDADGVLTTRSLPTGPDGHYVVHAPPGDVQLFAWRRGARVSVGVVPVGTASADLTLGVQGHVHVTAVDDVSGEPLPVRVSIFPIDGTTVAPPSDRWGEDTETTGRVIVEYAHTGDTTVPVPDGRYRVVVSRGFEYEIVETEIDVTDTTTIEVPAVLSRVVDTTNVQCGDFHIHTRRSADAPDAGLLKVRAAVADGLEIPVRSDHEYVNDFSEEIAALGMERFAYSITSIEMTSMEIWGHMGVFPLEVSPGERNGGAPYWQEFPEPATPDTPLRTMEPNEVFDVVRARLERPTVIINHPMGDTNYFGYAGYDPITGLPARPEVWDEDFTLVEVFNDASWVGGRVVPSWLGLLDDGRRVFAVGSSDSHSVRGSPVGYPRTCIDVGTDDPRELTPTLVRDRLLEGRATISGGIFVDAWAAAGTVGPGGDAMAVGMRTPVRVRVQAASWVDVDALDVVVDGTTVDTIEILPGDASPDDPTVRFDREIEVDVAGGDGSYVIFAAYGDSTLEPVLRDRIPFGVTNPIFLHR